MDQDHQPHGAEKGRLRLKGLDRNANYRRLLLEEGISVLEEVHREFLTHE